MRDRQQTSSSRSRLKSTDKKQTPIELFESTLLDSATTDTPPVHSLRIFKLFLILSVKGGLQASKEAASSVISIRLHSNSSIKCEVLLAELMSCSIWGGGMREQLVKLHPLMEKLASADSRGKSGLRLEDGTRTEWKKRLVVAWKNKSRTFGQKTCHRTACKRWSLPL